MRFHRQLIFSLLFGSALLLGQQGPHARQEARFGGPIPEYVLELQQAQPARPLDTAIREPSQVVFGYHPYWNGTAYQNYNYDLISHLAWFCLTMNADGNITNANGWPWNDLINLAHSHDVKVIVTVTLFDNDDIATLLSSATRRQNAIDNLISWVSTGNADGVNIDFESVPSGSSANFNTFINDLTTAFHDQIPGSEVSIAMPSVDWWNSYDYGYLNDHCDGLMIMAYGYYWSGSSHAGPISPLHSGFASWYISRTIEDYLSETGNDASKLMLGLPWYGYDWPVSGTAAGAATTGTGSAIFYSSAEAEAQSFGKHYSSQAPAAWYNYTSSTPHQVWYDDSSSLVAKYDYAAEMDLMGIGIWALGYDGGRPEIWGGLGDIFGATAPPLTPPWFSAQVEDDGSVAITCAPVSFADSFLVYAGTDVQDLNRVASSTERALTVMGLPADTSVYLQVRAVNEFGMSGPSEVLGVGTNSERIPVLVVQGFERQSGTENTFDYIKEHGPAIWSAGYSFHSASNDAVIAGAIDLQDYAIVDWISGEEATATTSFDDQEQTAIKAYLEGGGRLFVSGSEIGWDLEANGSNSDRAFYQNYFKADYVSDDAGSYSMYGLAYGAFHGISNIQFDNGYHGTYNVDYPDGLRPHLGSQSVMQYSNVEYDEVGGAALQYTGTFGESNMVGGIIYMGVGFEAIYPASKRAQVMTAALDYLASTLDLNEPVSFPEGFAVEAAYPNPFNASVTVPISLSRKQQVEFTVFNLVGRQIHHESKTLHSGRNIWTWNAQGSGSGIYMVHVDVAGTHTKQKVTLIK